MHRLRGLDGLRAVAVAGVVLYHADLSSVPGGFLGVDVFFVLSGYLITSLLLGGWEGIDRIDLGVLRRELPAFFRARARRLLPALFVVLAATVAVTTLAVPDAAAEVRSDLLPALAYVSNWWQVVAHHSYFEQTGRPPLLLHLWSLGVEEQFYLVWPLVLLMLLRLTGPGPRRRRLLMRVAGGGALASTVLMAIVAVRYSMPVPNDPSRAYYGTDTHAGGLLLGAALGVVWPLHRRPAWSPGRRLAVDIAGWVALTALIGAFAAVSEFSALLYRGGFLVVSGLAAVVVAALAQPESSLGRVLGAAPLRWLGERSYGIYLWHWPVFELTRPQLDVQETGTANLLLRVVLTLGLAELTWRYVETPVRAGALRRVRPTMQRMLSRVDRTLPLLRRHLRVPVAALTLTALLAAGFATDRPSPDTGVSAAPVPVVAAQPDPDTNPPALPPLPPGAITAWGDSVMLGARSSIRAQLPQATVDAVVGRRAEVLPAALTVLRRNGRLGSVVVLHIGDNGLFGKKTLDRVLDQLTDRQRVVLVTIRVPRRWQDPVNALLRAGAHARANVVLADWNAASARHREYFVGDGVHLTVAGSRAFAGTIAHAIH